MPVRIRRLAETHDSQQVLFIGDSLADITMKLGGLQAAGFITQEMTMSSLAAVLPISDVRVHHRWKRFGLGAAVPQDSSVDYVAEGKRTTGSQDFWFLCYDWNPRKGTAWEVMTQSLSRLNPQNGISLSPSLIVPLIFLTRWGEYPSRQGDNTQARWFDHCIRAYDLTYNLICGLYRQWAIEDRCSRAMKTGQAVLRVPLTPAQQEAVHRFRELFGADTLDRILDARHLEAALIPVMDEASARLWRKDVATATAEDTLVQGLLPLALWRPAAEAPTAAREVWEREPEEIGAVWLACNPSVGPAKQADAASYRQVLATALKYVPSNPSLDVALLGAAIENAAAIDIDLEARRVEAALPHPEGTRFTAVNFGDIREATPPLDVGNILVELHSESWGYVGQTPMGRAGIHIVPLAVAATSVLFTKLPSPPRECRRNALTYAAVMYLEYKNQVGPNIHNAGLLIALNEQGGLAAPLMPFPTDGVFKDPDDPEFTVSTSQIAHLVYLMLACFMRVNRKEAIMTRSPAGLWRIGQAGEV